MRKMNATYEIKGTKGEDIQVRDGSLVLLEAFTIGSAWEKDKQLLGLVYEIVPDLCNSELPSFRPLPVIQKESDIQSPSFFCNGHWALISF